MIFKISFKDGDLRTNEKQSKEVLNEALLTFSSLRLLTGCVIYHHTPVVPYISLRECITKVQKPKMEL